MAEIHHLQWGAEALWEALDPVLPGVSVEVVARLESTNTRLIERARQAIGVPDAPVTRPGELEERGGALNAPYGRRARDIEPCLLVAEHQTGGRGRLGRDWRASPGASLTFSLALPMAPRDWSGLSLAVGVALADALEPRPAAAGALEAPDRAPQRLALKWPNDLWLVDDPAEGALGGRKLGGILIETLAMGARRMCVVGVGLNVLPQEMSGVASLSEIDPGTSAPAALAAVAVPLAQALKRFEREGFAPFAADYARRDLLRGRRVSTTAPGVPEGTAEGVDEDGALRVRTPEGVQRVSSGEVSVRLNETPC